MIALQTWETVSAPPSATGTGLSEFGAAIAAASHDSAAVTAPSRDSAIAAAASQDSAVVAATLHDRAVATAALRDSAVVADVGAPATRAAADRLQPSTTVGWMSVDDSTGEFFSQFLLTKNHKKSLPFASLFLPRGCTTWGESLGDYAQCHISQECDLLCQPKCGLHPLVIQQSPLLFAGRIFC